MRALRLLGHGLRATTANLGLAVAACLILAVFSGTTGLLVDPVDASGDSADMKTFLVPLLQLTGLQLATTIFVGPIMHAAAAFSAFKHSRGKPASAYAGLNFAISRYARMLPAHATAWAVITLGFNLLILPGIWYWAKWGLVDAVAIFEKTPAKIRRTEQLTRGYRRTIFVMALPLFVYDVAWMLIDFQLIGTFPPLVYVHHVFVHLAHFVVFAGYTRLYLERTGQAEAKEAAPAE